MAAIRVARAVTGRPLVVKFEGHYHGWHDAFLVSSHPRDPSTLGDAADPPRVLDSQGLPEGAVADTILCAWNDAGLLADCLDRHRGRVAAVITEPVMANMGVIPPRPGYLAEMRRLCDEHGALLIVDETVTGFRLDPGGCQALYGVTGDLATFGKALGAGVPLAAITGRAEVMDAMAGGRVLHYGTQNAPNLALSIAAESLDMLTEDDGAGAAEMTRLGERLAAGLAEAFGAASIPAVVQGVGPMLQVLPLRPGHEDAGPIHDMRDFCTHADPGLYRRFVHELFGLGRLRQPGAAPAHDRLDRPHRRRHRCGGRGGPHRCGAPVSRPTIGITSYWTQAAMSHWSCDAVLVSQGYVEGVRVAGGRPVVLPADTTWIDEPDDVLDVVDALLVVGGNDIDPELLRAGARTPRSAPQPDRRDAVELALVRRARRARRAVARHLPRHPAAERGAGRHARPAPGRLDRLRPAPPVRLQLRPHEIVTVPGSRRRAIVGERRRCARTTTRASTASATASSSPPAPRTASIEAIEHPGRPFLRRRPLASGRRADGHRAAGLRGAGIVGPDEPRLWHPFADMAAVKDDELVIVRGRGARVWDDDGKEYIDARGGLWYAAVGHGRTEIADAAAAQMRELAAYDTFDRLANRPALELAERVSALAPFARGSRLLRLRRIRRRRHRREARPPVLARARAA